MNSKNLTLIIIAVVLLLFVGCGCNGYNSMVRLDQAVKTSWSNVETNYQRRTDLYSSVIKVIEGSANFEKSTLTQVIAARASATQIHVDLNDSTSLTRYQQAQGQLQSSFGRLMAVAESYPDLKTTQQFKDFQTEIEGTENRINVARRDFNTAVGEYNLKVKSFPSNIYAGIFGYHERGYYKADAGTENAPEIHFDIK